MYTLLGLPIRMVRSSSGKIIDPLNVKQGDYKLWINPEDTVDLERLIGCW